MKTYKKIFLLLFFLLISSINFNLILKPLNLVTGGTQGISLLINHITGIKPSLIILIINFFMLILSYFLLGINPTKGILIATFIYPMFVRLISVFMFSFDTNNYLIILVIIAGIISGITNGFILKLGYSAGGINVLVLIFKKYFNIKESISIFFINSCIIMIGMLYFGVFKAICSIFLILISSITINRILYVKNV